MKTSLIALAVAAALTACSQSDRTASNNADRTAMLKEPPAGYSAPPAPAQRGPIPPNANTMAPGTDASAAFANEPSLKDMPPQKQTGAPADEEHRAVEAQEAAARAPDTASADKAKQEIMAGNDGSRTGDTARDTEANQPRHGTQTKQEEVNEMPKAGQANNHSSTALEKDSGR